SRLAARSLDWFDTPVTLASGRARDATRPVPTGSPATGKTIGMIAVACFAARAASVPAANITSTLSRTNSAAISAKRSGRPSAHRYSYDGAALAPAEHAEPLGKGDSPLALSRWSRAAQPSDRRHPCLLRARRERPRRRAAEQRDELAPRHS